jgi:hypothetical protein
MKIASSAPTSGPPYRRFSTSWVIQSYSRASTITWSIMMKSEWKMKYSAKSLSKHANIWPSPRYTSDVIPSEINSLPILLQTWSGPLNSGRGRFTYFDSFQGSLVSTDKANHKMERFPSRERAHRERRFPIHMFLCSSINSPFTKRPNWNATDRCMKWPDIKSRIFRPGADRSWRLTIILYGLFIQQLESFLIFHINEAKPVENGWRAPWNSVVRRRYTLLRRHWTEKGQLEIPQ